MYPTVAVESLSLAPAEAQTIDVGGSVAFTASVAPANATDKTVAWSVGGTNASAVKLYSDEDCTTEVGAEATSTLTVYAKGASAGSATVTATSNADGTKSASCSVTVNPVAYTVTYKVANGTWADGTTADKTETVEDGSKPASVPVGMKASDGYAGGTWDADPAGATITGATTFTYTFTEKQASAVTLSYAKAKVTKKVGCKAFANKLTNESKVSVTYKSSNAKVATVDGDGRVTVKAAGTTKITATFAGDGSREAASASYRLVVGLSKVTGVKTVCHPGEKTIDVSWKKVAGANRYQVQWRVAGGKWKTAKTKGLTKTIRKLKKGRLYQVRVRAVSGRTRGAWSKVSRRWFVPATGVAAKSASKGKVRVRWSATEGANEGYTIFVYDARTDKVLARRTVGAKRTTATIKGLKSSKKIRVAVRPLRSVGGYSYLGILTSTTSLWVS